MMKGSGLDSDLRKTSFVEDVRLFEQKDFEDLMLGESIT